MESCFGIHFILFNTSFIPSSTRVCQGVPNALIFPHLPNMTNLFIAPVMSGLNLAALMTRPLRVWAPPVALTCLSAGPYWGTLYFLSPLAMLCPCYSPFALPWEPFIPLCLISISLANSILFWKHTFLSNPPLFSFPRNTMSFTIW